MRNEFTAVIERDGEWFVGWSPEIPAPTCRVAALSNAVKVSAQPSN
jgi:hypothetical protein